jgi:hypothetical protein
MKACQLIARATLDAAHLQFIRQMFDDAWRSIAPKYRTPLKIGAARLALASAIVIAASNGLDPEDVRRVAIAIVAPDHEA